MSRKEGSKQLWIDGKLHAQFKKKILDEGWTWGITKKLESIVRDYVEGSKGQLPAGGRRLGGVSIERNSPANVEERASPGHIRSPKSHRSA